MEINIEELGRKALSIMKNKWGLPSSGFIAGGSISNLVWELVSNNKSVVNDIDVFALKEKVDKFKSSDRTKLFRYNEKEIKYFEDYSGLSYVNKTKDFYSICDSCVDGIFNYISYTSNTDDLMIILNSFDINAVQFGYSIDQDKFYWKEDFLEFLNTGKLKVTSLRTPAHTAIRLAKKSIELNAYLDDFELKLISFSLLYFNDKIKKCFKEKYYNLFLKYQNILSNYFSLIKDEQIERYVQRNFNEIVDLYTLIPKEQMDFNDKNIFLINNYYSDKFLFYIRNIYGNEKLSSIWRYLNIFFDYNEYLDIEVNEDDILLLNRLTKYAPNCIENLKDYKISEQLVIVKNLFEKYQDDPIIAISILEKFKINIDESIDDDTFLLMELMVRKQIVNDTKGKVNRILTKENEEKRENSTIFFEL